MNKQITNSLKAKNFKTQIIYLSKINIWLINSTILKKLGDRRCLHYSKKQDSIRTWESEKSKEKNRKVLRVLLAKLLIFLDKWHLLVTSIWAWQQNFNWKKKIGEVVQKINRFPSVVNKLTGLTVLYKKKK